MKDIFIIGSGGFAKEVAFLIDEINRRSETLEWNVVGFVTEDAHEVGKYNGKYKIVAHDSDLFRRSQSTFVTVGIGSPEARRAVFEKMQSYTHFVFPNLIHPSVIIDRERVTLQDGNLLMAGCVFTSDINIGKGNVFNLSCTIGHDCEIGDWCVINPGSNLSGGLKIGKTCLIGTSATILQNITIGDEAKIGAGAVVTKNVDNGVTMVGVPAKPLMK